jgi:ubiquinone biosynthesis protein COQ9
MSSSSSSSPGAFLSTAAAAAEPDDHNSSRRKKDGEMDLLKGRLAEESLKHVPKFGWTQDAIATAAMEHPQWNISMSGLLSPTDLVHWFMDDMNRQLRERKGSEGVDDDDADESSSVYRAMKWRLERVVPFVESGQWHRGMALGLSTPAVTQNQLREFIDIVAPPHSSTAYRAALGAIFAATELHLLADSSTNHEDTWTFLRNRLQELERHQDDPSQLLSTILSSSSSSSSFSSMKSIDTGIPLMASIAVAQSLLDGLASLVMPNTAPGGGGSSSNRNNHVMGTKASDYDSSNSR